MPFHYRIVSKAFDQGRSRLGLGVKMADDVSSTMRFPFGLRALFLMGLFPLLRAQGEHPAFRRFGLMQGLPQSQVSALLEDRHGFIWVGTLSGGMARLGASGFRVFGATEGVQARSVVSLLEDPDGHIWAAGRDTGLTEIAGERVINHGTAQGLIEARLYALAMDTQKRLLVGTARGLYRREGNRFSPVPLPGEWSQLPIFRLAVDAAGSLWATSRKGRIIRWDGSSLVEEHLPGTAQEEIQDFQADAQGRIWALTESHLFRRDPQGWTMYRLSGLPPMPKFVSFSFDLQGQPVIALGGDGVWMMDHGAPKVLSLKDGLPKDLINVAMIDHNGSLWVGSDGDGLAARIVSGLWSYGSGDLSAPFDLGAVMTFEELPGGNLLLSTNRGVYLFQEGKGVLRHWGKAQGLGSESLWSSILISPTEVWLGTDRGMNIWRQGRILPGPKELETYAITEFARFQGKVYAATEKGMAVLSTTGKFDRFISVPPEFGPRGVNQLLAYGENLLVAGNAGTMILKQDRLEMMKPPELGRLFAADMRMDQQGRLWIASSTGLVRVEGSRISTIGTREGLLDETFTWALELNEGLMAAAHGHGVSFISEGGIQHLTRNMGLLSDETNQNGVLLDRKGRLWIGMMGGFNRLDAPGAFRNAPMQAPVVLEARWPGSSVTLPTRLELPPQPEVLELRFDLGQPALPAAPRYQALLEGVDSDWRDVSQGNALQYLHLGQGKRTFRLRATMDGIKWVETQPMHITVSPAWHERWSVRTLFAFALVGILTLGMRWRLRRLALAAQQLEAMVEDRTHMLDRQYTALAQAHEQIKRSLESRIRLVDMVTHDLRSPLTTITLVVDRLRDEEEAEERAGMLQVLERESQRIDELLRTLLDRSRTEASLQNLQPIPTTPLDVLEGIQEVLRLKAEAKGLTFHLDLPGEQAHSQVLVDATALRQAILNLFENAVKFTPAGGQVGVRSRLDMATLEWVLAIWDTGRGIPKEKQPDILKPFSQVHQGDASQGWGLGLSIVQGLVEAHGGSLGLESDEGQGATFFIALPLLAH